MKARQIFTCALLLSVWTISSPYNALADDRINTTNETLLNRIQVEDFINDYYWELATEAGAGISGFWADDAVFDVNGAVVQGIDAIKEVYSKGLGPGGRLVFQMDIPRIQIHANQATVDLIYTGVLNVDPKMAPRLYEQGHDHIELIKNNGGWKITKRVLRSFSLDQSTAQ